ncbi:MAG: transposase [Anaerolineaceae bacterium]|nr:transposase [Anaerolineaceae bacterium]MBN2677062.1 transposase [Anaerolineaceae bacterium]
MAKRITEFYQDGIYHLYNRGVDGRKIFIDDQNYLFFNQRLHRYSSGLSITILAYCLMPTHFHLLVQQNGEISAGILCQRICNSYTKAFNNWVHRTGSLFESKYKAIDVDREDYLLHITRYIHANPVKGGLADLPEKWLYSDYGEWMRHPYLDKSTDTVRGLFISASDYASFVHDYINDTVSLPEDFARYTLE